jgi:hypothetical protein
MGPEVLHFYQVPRLLKYFWSTEHTLNSKEALGDRLIKFVMDIRG